MLSAAIAMNGVLMLRVFLLFFVNCLFASLAVAAQPDGQTAARKHALVIGNSSYAGSERLQNPANDAELIARTLRRMGFTVTLLRDRTQRMQMEDVVAFSKQAQDADIVFFYYAGHGLAVDDINYLIPVDVSLQRTNATDLKTNGVSIKVVASYLQRTNAKAIVMAIDACRNSPMRGTSLPGMKKPDAVKGMIQLYSTLPGAKALDGQPAPNSPFALAMSRYLGNSALSITDVAKFVRNDVRHVTVETQIPWVADGLAGELRLSASEPLPSSGISSPNLTAPKARGLEAENEDIDWALQLDDREQEIQRAVVAVDVPSLDVIRFRDKEGDVIASTILGHLYLTGSSLTKKSTQLAVRYLSKAAKMDFPIAQTLLGEMYAEGKDVPRDLQKAENLMARAAQSGHSRARMNMISIRQMKGQPITYEDMRDIGQNSLSVIQRRNQKLVDEAMRKQP